MSASIDTRTIKQKLLQLAKDKANQNNMLFEVVNNTQAHIIYNRPKLMNAFSFDMYFTFCQFISKANEMEEIKYIVIRGAGGNFSSGNDLNNFMHPMLADLDRKLVANTMAEVLVELTETIVKSKKPIFALLQGKVIGFAFTKLALFDRVFAAESAYFMAPLVKIAQGPEMASSYLFPKIFGQSLAQQIIIKAQLMTPKELQKYNFLSCYKNIGEASKALQTHLNQLDQLDWASYLQARKLMRLADKENILIANILQCQNLVERWSNPDLPAFLMKYLTSRKEKPKL